MRIMPKDNSAAKNTAQSRRQLIFEFLRYAAVGGVSAIVDMGVLWAFTEFVFDGKNFGYPLAVSITAGFVAGLIVNYLLSAILVFTTREQKKRSRSLRSFLLYALVGVIG